MLNTLLPVHVAFCLDAPWVWNQKLRISFWIRKLCWPVVHILGRHCLASHHQETSV